MRVLVVPDVHGSTHWKKVLEIDDSTYDHVVFLGDYFDSYDNKWPSQGENFQEICDFVRKDTQRRHMLLGNHDHSYISSHSNCSGHQYDQETTIRNLLVSNYDIIDLAFECDDWVFSHAGFSKTSVKIAEDVMNRDFNIKNLNEYWHSLTPEEYSKFEHLLNWFGMFDPTGDEPTQFCLWIRPNALLQDAYFPKQVVGHTEISFGEPIVLSKKGNTVVLMDNRLHTLYDVFDTQQERESMDVLQLNKYFKKLTQAVNDIKAKKIEDETKIIQELEKDFSKKVAEFCYPAFFKES